jgi:NAD-dependent dihydropyrimidine dehydrogenase PreA subunit
MAEEMMWEGIPRREVPWYPTINYELCIGCRSCIEHCSSGVYAWDETENHPIVVQPYNCLVYCQGCAKGCSEDAIIFPDKQQIVALVKELRTKYATR